jgi:hypothetical protein
MQSGFVTSGNGSFWLGGNMFSYMGVNLRGISHYGYPVPLPYSSDGDQERNLQGLSSMGGRVARLFACHLTLSPAQTLDRLRKVLDKFATYDVRAIIALTDSYPTGFYPNGDDAYYMLQPNNWTILDDSWFSGGWKVNYWPQVQTLVTALANHTAIFAWEVGNELQDQKNPGNMVTFVTAVSNGIRAIDPNHLITTGFISSDHTLMNVSQALILYSNPNVGFLTFHTYNGDRHDTINRAVYCALDKPMIVEEFGWDESDSDRSTKVRSEVDYWYEMAFVRGFGNWGFQAQAHDIGDGDNEFGMDTYHAHDYTALFDIFSGRAAIEARRTQNVDHKTSPYCRS